MENKKKKMLVITIIFIVISVVVVGFVYFKQLKNATEDITRATMEELAAHDSENIQSKVNGYWNELDSIYARLQSRQPKTIQDVCTHLNMEQISGMYSRIFLVDEDGRTYSGINRIIDQSNRAHVKKLLDGEQRIALNYEYREDRQLELKKEVLAVGSKEEMFTVEGIRFIGIIGFIELKQLEDKLNVSCFDGAGKTAVIDVDGYYIVNSERSEGIARRDNYFAELAASCKNPREHIQRIRSRIETEHEFYDRVECGLPKGEVAYYHALENTDWIMIITVPESVIAQSSNRFVEMSGAMLFVLVGILIVAGCISVSFFLDSVREKANSRARSEFLSMMSHEIRTPLNGLIGLNYLMQSNMQDEEKMQEYLDKSAATGQYLLSLINDILDMSKLQAGKMELYEQPFSIKYMISTIESIMRGRMEDKRIDFTIEQEIIEDIVIGDETRIEQILMNILGNAVKFVDEQGHVLLRVKQTRVDKTSVQTVYEVTDDGCGITEEFQNHIFDSFAQERNKIGSDKKGTGLGMAISSLLVQQMKGTLTVKSRLEEGSVFTLTLVSEVSEAKPDTVIVTETAEHEPYVEHKLHILLAEDQDLNAEILMELLEEKGFLVERAADGVEVVDMFAQSEPNTYDLILMDVQMPNRNGYEATKMIRELQREDARSVLIYACTANAFREDRDMALQSGMDDFISKPIHVEKLMSKLKVKFSGGGIIENAEI